MEEYVLYHTMMLCRCFGATSHDPPPESKKKESISHPARHIGSSRSNQREPLASPDSPSSCASLVTLHSRVGCPCVGTVSTPEVG